MVNPSTTYFVTSLLDQHRTYVIKKTPKLVAKIWLPNLVLYQTDKCDLVNIQSFAMSTFLYWKLKPSKHIFTFQNKQSYNFYSVQIWLLTHDIWLIIMIHDSDTMRCNSELDPWSGDWFHQISSAIWHYTDVIMGTMASQITSLTIVYSAVYSGADQRKHQSSVSLPFVRGIHRGPVNSPHKWPVTWKMFPFDDVIMIMTKLGLYMNRINAAVWWVN